MDIWHFYNNEDDMRNALCKIDDIIHKEYNTKIIDLYYNCDNDEWVLVLDYMKGIKYNENLLKCKQPI